MTLTSPWFRFRRRARTTRATAAGTRTRVDLTVANNLTGAVSASLARGSGRLEGRARQHPSCSSGRKEVVSFTVTSLPASSGGAVEGEFRARRATPRQIG
jgi:hypothetical protein